MMIFPIQLDGNSLGKMHKQLNELTNNVIKNKLPLARIKDLTENCDAERLLKIDVASAQRNVEYILYNMQCDDMLYVSRAMRSTWLIKDSQHAHIINPQHLHDHLFPLMINKAVCKLKLTIRLHLKDKNRCEQFFQYYYHNNDKRQALLFLPLCSKKFILNNVLKNKLEIPRRIIKRVCKKVPATAYEIIRPLDPYLARECIEELRFLAKTDTKIYLDLIEKHMERLHYEFVIRNLGRRSTFSILQHHQARIFSKPKHYLPILHLPTTAKVLDSAKVKELIVKLSTNPDLDNWFSYKNIKPLLKVLPYSERYVFMKSIIEKKILVLQDNCPSGCTATLNVVAKSSVSDIYEWYCYIPFPTAFSELKKFISIEPKCNERLAMLFVLVECAKRNATFLEQLLKYFYDQHIHNTKNFKKKFVKHLLTSTRAFRYNDACWKTLDMIFHNLDVYIEGSSNIEGCVETIMLYYILKDASIPNGILEKWLGAFSTMQPMAKKLNLHEQEKVLAFLYASLKQKINELSLDNADDSRKVTVLTNNYLELLKDWKQPLAQHPDILELLKIVIRKAEALSLLNSLNFYGQVKEWNRLLFSEALLVQQTQDIFLYALKHDSEKLKNHKVQLQRALESNTTNLDRFLSKLRIYFYNDLAVECLKGLKSGLGEAHGKTVARAICILMHRDSFSELAKSCVPLNFKIKWSEENARQLNPRKYLIQHMFLVRPLVNVAVIYAFIKEDYLQYALPSLNSICFQLPVSRCNDALTMLLKNNASTPKHASLVVFANLSALELQDLFFKLWEQATNTKIKAVVFKLTFEALCREKKEDKIVHVWALLKFFLSKLTTVHRKSVYSTLGQAEKVPVKIRADFCTISYRYLKTVPKKQYLSRHIYKLLTALLTIIDTVDNEFVYEIMKAHFQAVFIDKIDSTSDIYLSGPWNLFYKFLVACKSEEEQLDRYNKIGTVFMKHTKDLWYTSNGWCYPTRWQFREFHTKITMNIKEMIFVKNQKYITPLPLLKLVIRDVEYFGPLHDFIHIHVNLRLLIALLESFDSMTEEMGENLPDKMEEFDTLLHRELGKRFGLKCGAIYEEYSRKLFPSFISIFSEKVHCFLTDYLGYSYFGENGLLLVMIADALSIDPKNIPNIMLSIATLPSFKVCEQIKADYTKVFKKLQAIENTEVKLHFNNTFSVTEKLID